MQEAYVLEANGLSKKYKHYQVLHSLSIHVEKGAIYGLVGKNGAGKTTLIRLLCGLQQADAGEYTLYGVANHSREIVNARRRMGAVVETPSIYLDLTAQDNLKEQFQVLGIPSFQGIPALLELVGLADTGKKKAKNFSLGMRQRLGIAVALAGNPDFLVLDEPVNGLDPQGIVEMRELLLRLNREHQITVLISSHILDELSRLATHFGFLDNGRIVQEISAQELEAASRKCRRLEVTNLNALAAVLTQMGIPFTVRSKTEADVYGEWNISQVTLALAEENCEITQLTQRDESLESYYINLVGGDQHER